MPVSSRFCKAVTSQANRDLNTEQGRCAKQIQPHQRATQAESFRKMPRGK